MKLPYCDISARIWCNEPELVFYVAEMDSEVPPYYQSESDGFIHHTITDSLHLWDTINRLWSALEFNWPVT